MSRALPACLIVSLLLAPPAAAGTLKVPADKPSIAAAVADAVAGDLILVSPGTYAEAITLTGVTDIEVRAKGKVVLDVESLAVRLEDCNGVTVRGFSVALGPGLLAGYVTTSDDCVLEDLEISGGSLGVQVEDATNISLRDCRFTDISSSAVFARACSGLLVEDCEFDGAIGVGIQCGESGSDPVTDSTLLGNRLRGCSLRGIDAIGADRLLIEDNVIEDGDGDGISLGLLVAASACTVQRNTVRDMAGDGIFLQGAAHVVRLNVLKDLGANGIYVGADSDGGHQILDNQLTRIGDVGIEVLAGSAGDLVAGNVVKQPATDGVRVNGDGTVVYGNTVTTAGADGFKVGGSACMLVGNTSRTAGANGFRVTSTGQSLTGNTSKGPAEAGFAIEAEDNTLTANTAKSSGTFGLLDSEGGNNTYVANSFDSEEVSGGP